MPDLKDREIFAVGRWNGLEFTEADLDDIVQNFERLRDVHKVPLKFGHNDEQPITDGQPAIGWVSRVYRSGKKLLADFADVPQVVYDAIKKRLYRTVSVELLFGVDHGKNRYNHVLDAVALLGADHPAVNTLDDLRTLLATRTDFSGGRRVVFETVAGTKTTVTPQEDVMDEKEVKKLIASALEPLQEANKALETENKELREKVEAADREKKEFARKEAEAAVKKARDAVNEVLDGAVKDKKMTPAVRETYAKQIGVDDDERVVKIDLEQVRLMCGATKGADTGPAGRVHKEGDVTEDKDKDPSERLYKLTRENMAQTGEKDYAVAFNRVCAANEELHRAYLDSNGVKGRD